MTTPLHEIARTLVGFDTVSAHSNAAAAEYLADRLDAAGFRVRLHRHDDAGAAKVEVVACAGPDAPDGLVVSGHIDTVPFADQAGWTRDPLRLELTADRVYGRGVADMKGFLAHGVAAAAVLDMQALDRPLVFVFTSDEEIASGGARRLVPVLPQLTAPTPLPRLAWIGEPTSYRIFHTHKGIVLFDVTVHGTGGHSSVPEQGVNAIAVMARAIATITDVQAELRTADVPAVAAEFPECPYVTVNVATVHGGSAVNMIPDRCVLEVSYRPLPDSDPRAPYEAIRARLAACDRIDPGSDRAATIDVGEPFVVPAMLSPRGTPLEHALGAVLGPRPTGGAPFATDGCELARAGIQALICGPGELEQAHQPNESMPRDVFERGPDVVADVVRRLCTAARNDR